MRSEEFKQRMNEAKSAQSCLDWHQHCKAECCKVIFINIPPTELDKKGAYIDIQKKISFNERWYYKLRGVKYVHGVLRFRKDRCISLGGRIVYVNKCELLDGYLCRGHPDKKPEICKALTLETAHKEGQNFELTDNCLFNYKGVEGDEKQEA